LQNLSDLIDQDALSGARKELFSYAGRDPVYVHLTGDEKQMIRSFIAKGIEELPAQP
jgi:hypothetical protein